MKNKWLGFWDYTVILTYCSLVTAVVGIIISLSGKGHPYVGAMLLLFCGLFDTFDGKVARSKKNRTELEKQFGVQIDSLADLVAFGIFPVCIGFALYRRDLFDIEEIGLRSRLAGVPMWVLIGLSALFVLCALIRLAYFNVTVEETQGADVDEKIYWGLPVTITALIFPSYLLVRHAFYVNYINISWMYFVLLIIIAIMFIRKFKLKKPGNGLIYIAIVIGAIEFLAVVTVWLAGHTR